MMHFIHVRIKIFSSGGWGPGSTDRKSSNAFVFRFSLFVCFCPQFILKRGSNDSKFADIPQHPIYVTLHPPGQILMGAKLSIRTPECETKLS